MASLESQIDGRWQLAVRAAAEAGRITLKYFQQGNYQVSRKADGSPVTEADRESERLLREIIESEFPNDGIVGEEFTPREGQSGFRWILDPIDGTKSFISGVPLYGTLVGVQYEERSVVGVIEMPALDERVHGATGQGAWHIRGNHAAQRCQVTNCEKLVDGLVLTSEIEGWSQRRSVECLIELQRAGWFMRTWGDCYGYLLVVTGRALAMVDPIMNIWDAAAVQPILEEAGGIFTDWEGLARSDGGDGIGTNHSVHQEVLEILGGAANQM